MKTNNLRVVDAVPTTVTQHAGGSGDGGNGMEARLAKVEAAVEHIQSTLTDIKADVREMRTTLTAMNDSINKQVGEVKDRVGDVKDRISSAKVWALLLYLGMGAALLLTMAKGFHWL